MSTNYGLTNWLHYLENLPPHSGHYSLANIKQVARRLGILPVASTVVMVAGTNGKGSCVVLLEAILLAAGFSTGAYISPHLMHYTERIRFNGRAVNAQLLSASFTQITKAQAEIPLNYFEYATLAALIIFKQAQPDFLLLEVGLGGRVDPVNIVDADIAVLTTISLEHTKILGNTRELIGREKAGIMRPCKPVVCGDSAPPLTIPQSAFALNAPLYCLNQEFFYSTSATGWEWRSARHHFAALPLLHLPCQVAATALMVIELLAEKFKIAQSAITTGLAHAVLPGRWHQEVIAGKRVIFDVAHNPEATTLLAYRLLQQSSAKHVRAVMGILQDKAIGATIQPLLPIVSRWYLGKLTTPRTAALAQLTRAFLAHKSTNFRLFPGIAPALQQAIAECDKKDTIIVFGSFLTVAEGLKMVGDYNVESCGERL